MELVTIDKEMALRAFVSTYKDTKGGDVPDNASRKELADFFANDVFISMAASATTDKITEDDFRDAVINHFGVTK